ncbi:MAG: hypothetical protein ACYTF0_01095 [Planctomycetota bacterium]|jgi:hypothetical protein
MTIRFIAPTLAAVAMIPAGNAFEISTDKGWDIALEPRIQSRVEFADVSDANGDDIDLWDDSADPQDVNFMLRRARVYFKGKNDAGWKFNFTIQADGVGAKGRRANGSNVGSDVELDLRYVWVGKGWETGDIKHFINFGLDKHSTSLGRTVSSSSRMTPRERPISVFVDDRRSVGVGYRLSAPLFGLEVGLADEPRDKFGESASKNQNNNDILFTARATTSIKEEWQLSKYKESYHGKYIGQGFKHTLGLGFDLINEGSEDDTGHDGYLAYQVDYIAVYDNWTISAAAAHTTHEKSGGDVEGEAFDLGVGYTVPLEAFVIEPNLRYSMVEDDNNQSGVYSAEYGGSGDYLDLGCNVYLDGHKNKFQAGLTIYSPEEGDGDATVVTLQHQLDF